MTARLQGCAVRLTGGSCVQISVGQHRRQTSPFMERQAHVTGYQAACAAVLLPILKPEGKKTVGARVGMKPRGCPKLAINKQTIYLNFRCTVEHVESSRSPSRKECRVTGH